MAKKKTAPVTAPTEVPEAIIAEHDVPSPFLSFGLDYLAFYGYLRDRASPEAVREATKEFQLSTGLPEVNGVIGNQVLETMWLPRCGVRDDAFTQAARWRKSELSWWVDAYLEGIPGLSKADQDDLQIQSLRDYEAAIDVRWKRATSRNVADLIVSVGQGRADGFDGPGGVLAWCQIPPGDDRPIIMKFDRSDSWIRAASTGQRGILYGNVDNHEKGHAHGMLHVPGPAVALLNAIYNPAVSRLQPADKQALFALGYPPATASPPPPPTSQRVVLTFHGTVPPFTVSRE